MRVLPQVDILDSARADTLFKLSESALRAAAANALAGHPTATAQTVDPGLYTQAIIAQYDKLLRNDELEGMTSKAALILVKNAAQTALLSVNKTYAVDGDMILAQVQAAAEAAWAEAVVATQTLAQYKAPDDVSCSMALLTWQETSDIFGRRVANTYVGIQVTVRNLNPVNEFLLHDIQVAVDTGIYSTDFSNELSRFQAGRDKLLVRNLAQRGQAEDRRNLALHALEAAGAIAGSSAIAGPMALATGVAVFQGAFIPGFSTLFPDHTVDQLNHINDLVFSASSSNKVLVPIQGSVPLVTFISEKPIEQLPFAWCGYDSKKVGDVSHFCSHRDSSFPWDPTPVRQLQHPWPANPYKDWKAAALRVLAEHTFVVVGGVHIKEITKQSAGSLTCQTLPTGAVDISVVSKDGVVSCTVTGSDLDSVASVALKKDSEKISGKIKPAADGSSAVLTFDPADLSNGDGVYSLYLVDKAGAESDTGSILRLSVQPVISVTDSGTTIDIGAAMPTLTVKGKHLDRMAEFSLVPASGGQAKKGVLPKSPPKDATELAITFAPADLSSGQKYSVQYAISDAPSKENPLSSLVVTVSGTAPAAGPPAPPKPEEPKVTAPGTAPAAPAPAAPKPDAPKPAPVKPN
jgi:hypothetical protein